MSRTKKVKEITLDEVFQSAQQLDLAGRVALRTLVNESIDAEVRKMKEHADRVAQSARDAEQIAIGNKPKQ